MRWNSGRKDETFGEGHACVLSAAGCLSNRVPSVSLTRRFRWHGWPFLSSTFQPRLERVSEEERKGKKMYESQGRPVKAAIVRRWPNYFSWWNEGEEKKKRKFREFAVGIIRRADGATRHRDSGPMFLRHHSIYEYRWKERNLIWPENAFRRWFLVNLVDRIMELDIVEQKWPMYRGWNREWFIGTLYGLYHVIGNGYLSWICFFFFFTDTYIFFFHIYNFLLLFLFRVFVTIEQIFRNLHCSIKLGYFWIVGDCRKVGINI